MRISDWSSDVCSSDLDQRDGDARAGVARSTGAVRRAADKRGAGILQARLRHRGGVGEVVAGRGFRTVVRQRPRLRAHERAVPVGRGYAPDSPRTTTCTRIRGIPRVGGVAPTYVRVSMALR